MKSRDGKFAERITLKKLDVVNKKWQSALYKRAIGRKLCVVIAIICYFLISSFVAFLFILMPLALIFFLLDEFLPQEPIEQQFVKAMQKQEAAAEEDRRAQEAKTNTAPQRPRASDHL